MNNLMNLLNKYNDKVLRVFCRPSFVNSVMASNGAAADERPERVGGRPMVEIDMREEYRLELTDGRVVHQDGSIDESPLTQFMRSGGGQQAVYRELVTLGLRIDTDEERVEVYAQQAEKEIKATIARMVANLRTRSYRKSRT